MTFPGPARRPSPKRRLGYVVLLCASVVAAFLVFTAARVVRNASADTVTHADAIVVFGAAEYAGRPSPVYRARLEHALKLFQQGAAPVVITTGGQGYDPRYSEGGVGRDYLISRGIPDSRLIAETQSNDTSESAQRVAVIMRANHMRSMLAVSDAYHMFRIKQLMRREGIAAYAAPRPDSWPRTLGRKIAAVARETASYALWRIYLN